MEIKANSRIVGYYLSIDKVTLTNARVELELPKDSRILSVGVRKDLSGDSEVIRAYLWVLGNPLPKKEDMELRSFIVAEEGRHHHIDFAGDVYPYIGTFDMNCHRRIFHVFEEIKK